MNHVLMSALQSCYASTVGVRVSSKSRGTVGTMSTIPEPSYSIGEVSEKTGLTTHTLRFYEKEGLFLEPIRRDESGRRRFSAEQIEWLVIGGKLRAAGMPLPVIRRYAEAGRVGSDAAMIQLQLLREHERRVQNQLSVLAHVLELVSAKIAQHENAASAVSSDQQ